MTLFEFATNEPTPHSPVYYTDDPDPGVQAELADWE